MASRSGFLFVLAVLFVLAFATSSYALEECKSLDLSGMPVYKVDKADHKCSSWTEMKSDGYYKIGCNLEAGTWRAHGIKEVDVSGMNALRVKATLKTTDSRVHYDDYVDLIVFTMDKGPELSPTCGKSTSDWANECVIKDRTSGSLGHCGLPKYALSRACDFAIDVSGRDKVYLTFITADAWDLAFGALKDTFENVQMCYEKAATPTPTPVQVKQNGQSCSSNSECESENCGSGICCAYGKVCCSYESDCSVDYECGSNYYCVAKAATPTPTPVFIPTLTPTPTRTPTPARTATPFPTQTRTPAPTPAATAGMVISVEPANDAEALEVKRLIENDIYPAIVVGVFDKNSGPVFSGLRDNDSKIKLRMTATESVAQWDESTNTLTIPYKRLYARMGNYDSALMQKNGIAHELVHYHFNGFAQRFGGDFKKAPLWFREGIAEYGAHSYYKDNLASVGNNPAQSVSEARRDVLASYLMDRRKNYKETVEENAIKTVSWNGESDWDKSIEARDHVYYGAAFSFVNYLSGKNTFRPGESTMDVIKYMFVMGSKGKFKFYAHANEEAAPLGEKEIKKAWFENLDDEYGIKAGLDNKPPSLLNRTAEKLNSFFRKWTFWSKR